MEESLVAYLLNSAALASLVNNRISWLKSPLNVSTPYIILAKISGLRDYRMQGTTGLQNSLVQADCFGATYSNAKAVARLVEARLSAYHGAFGTTTFQGVFLNAERDLYLDDESTSDLFGVSLDFNIWHKET